MPLMGSECRFVNIVIFHEDLVVPMHEIQLREPSCPAKLIQQLVNVWYREPVANGDGVESPVINTKPP